MFTEANGYKATFYNNNDAAQQIATAQQMIQDEVDFLLLSPASTTGWDTVLQDAQAAGTQIILFDRMLEADESMYVAAVVSDMPAEGKTAVDWLAPRAWMSTISSTFRATWVLTPSWPHRRSGREGKRRGQLELCGSADRRLERGDRQDHRTDRYRFQEAL